MAGHIDWKLNKKNEKIDGKKIVDVYSCFFRDTGNFKKKKVTIV